MNYIGSKKSIIDFVKHTILNEVKLKENKEYIFADLFSGTGIVGATFKEEGFKVIANDIQYYSFVISNYLLKMNDEMDEEIFKHLNELEGIEGFIYNNYCAGSGSERNYFTNYNGKKCDAIRTEIERKKNNNEITDNEYFYLIVCLLESIDKRANTASVYGAFLKKIKKFAQENMMLKPLPIIRGNINGEVYNKDVNDLVLKIKGDILYLDSPYNGRQYASNYHMLETISKYDDPVIRGKTGRRDYENQKSDFCKKGKVEEVFEYLISNAKFEHIFLSYNNEGLMSFGKIKEIMSKYGEYKVFTRIHRRYKADNSREYESDKTIEYLHYLKKKN